MAIRVASKKLVFLDLQSDGTRVQILSAQQHFQQPETFHQVHEALRRGDIVGMANTPLLDVQRPHSERMQASGASRAPLALGSSV